MVLFIGEPILSDSLSPSAVLVDADKVKPSVSAGWRQEGHLARKTLHHNPSLGKSSGHLANPGLLENGR